MTLKLAGTVAVVTGASSGIGYATSIALSRQGASVILVARRADRLDSLVKEITASGGQALAIPADITDKAAAQAVIDQIISTFGQLDILVNNAGLMLVGAVQHADPDEWERMISINLKGLLFMTHAALPHLLTAATNGSRRVADIVNISSQAGRMASENFAVYNMTKFGVNGFTEALRQEINPEHVRVGVLEPGAVATELVSHNQGEALNNMNKFFEETEVLEAEDIADGVVYMVTRPRRMAVSELWIMPTEQKL